METLAAAAIGLALLIAVAGYLKSQLDAVKQGLLDQRAAHEAARALAAPPPREVVLSRESYGRWIRAGKPSLEWFLALDDVSQDGLAKIHEEWMEQTLLAVGYAIKDPAAAELGIRAASGDADAEGALLQRISERVVGSVDRLAASLGRPGRRDDPVAAQERAVAEAPLAAVAASMNGEAPSSMGGIAERRTARAEAPARERAAEMSFLGNPPDGAPA